MDLKKKRRVDRRSAIIYVFTKTLPDSQVTKACTVHAK